MNTTPPIRFGITGLGGYAGYICDRVLDDARSAQPSATLVAVCDPQLDRFGRRIEELTRHGVAVCRSFEDLLASDIEAVWLPLPIDLHRPFTEQALAAGKAVMCEKPAAGCVDDVDAMIAARDAAGRPVAIGYQDMYHPAVATLKRRLVAGEFGKPRSARVIGCWPRTERYFGRNDWAGKFRRDGRWVMDSPANNAMAHFLHLSLFLLGPAMGEVAYPTSVAAELYRANRIENYDTCSLRFTVGGGGDGGDVPLLVGYTHACSSTVDPVITIETERGRIRYVAGRHVEIQMDGDGRGEILPLSSQPHRHMLSVFKSWLRDGPGEAVGATLEMARAHVVAVNAASEAAPVIDVPVDYVDAIPSADQTMLRCIREIVPALQSALADGVLLHETGLANWTRPAGAKQIDGGYHHFAGPATPTKNGHAAATANANANGAVRAETFVGKRAAAAAAGKV